jgi:hypothetical protein
LNVIKGMVDFWVQTWQSNKLLFWLEASGTVLGMVAAGILNFNSTNPNMLAVLILYFISAVLLACSSYIRESSFFVLLMTFYATTSIYGMINLFV